MLASLRVAAVLGLSIVSLPAFAQDCPDESTQGMVECLDKQTRAWDRKLNTAYQTALAAQSGKQRERLLAAQRLWIRYRDANCGFYAGGEGTISRIEAAQCMLKMTESRARELDEGQQP